MTSDIRKGHRELLEDFIRAYQGLPCLWRIKSKEYHDKPKKEAAYKILLEKYKLIDPNADRDAVVKKINSFRTNFRREKKKIEESRRSGAGADDVYEPSLWYYNLFDFLSDQETPRNSFSNIDEREEENVVDNLEESDTQEADNNYTKEIGCFPSEDNPIQSTSSKKSPRPSKRSNDKCDSLINTIEHHFKKPKIKDDRYDVMGKHVALKMKDIEDNNQKLFAEKIINEALFMAETGQLTMLHSITSMQLPPPSIIQYQQSNNGYNNQITDIRNNFGTHINVHEHGSSDENSNQSVSTYISNYSDF